METSLVTLAGTVSLSHNGGAVEDSEIGGPQIRLMLATLFIDKDQSWTSARLAEELWKEDRPERWRSAVRVLVSRVRRLLVRVAIDADAAIRSLGGRYVVDLPNKTADVVDALADLEAASHSVEGGPDRASTAAGEARAVLSGPLLPGVESPWLEITRRRHRRFHVDSLLVLGRARHRLGHLAAARTALAEASELDLLRERVADRSITVDEWASIVPGDEPYRDVRRSQ